MEIRESAILTRCSVLNLHGVHSTNFIPNLKARYKMSSFHFCERCLHSKQTSTPYKHRDSESARDQERWNSSQGHYHILYSLRAQVARFAVDLYLV